MGKMAERARRLADFLGRIFRFEIPPIGNWAIADPSIADLRLPTIGYPIAD